MHLPDVYDGSDVRRPRRAAWRNAKAVGFQKLLDDAVAAAEALPADVVYIGLSLGVMPAQQLAQTKPGARAAILVGSAVPADEFGDAWPAGVPLQIHGMDADPIFVGEGDIDAARELVAEAGAELFLYPGDGHLFIDNSLSDYDEAAAEQCDRADAGAARACLRVPPRSLTGDPTISDAIADWYERGHRDLPWRADGYPAWGILISEFMLQQTPVARVIPRLDGVAGPLADARRSGRRAARRGRARLGPPRLPAPRAQPARARRRRSPSGTATSCRATSTRCSRCPASGRTRRAPSPPSRTGCATPVVDINARRVLARAVEGRGEPGPAQTRRELALMESLLPADPARARLVNAGHDGTRPDRLHRPRPALRGLPDRRPTAPGARPATRRTRARRHRGRRSTRAATGRCAG